MKYCIEDVIKAYQSKKKIKYIFFWGHTETGGEITKACFSQWYPCKFEIDGILYHTAEQYMMAQKAKLFQDEQSYQKIMDVRHPKQFKELGRHIARFTDSIWDAHKYQIVLDGNLAKFMQNQELGAFLCQTGSRILVEASPYDKIWGIGLASNEIGVENPLNWKGENLLGFALMEVRDQLANPLVQD